MSIIITLLAALACFATAVIVPLVYIVGLDHVTVHGVTFSFVTWGLPALLGLIALNVFSGLVDQRHRWLYVLDHVASWASWLSINFTTAFVAFGYLQANQDILKILQESFAMQLLLGLVAYSWFDLVWIQRHKRRVLREWLKAQRVTTPAAAGLAVPPPVAPAVAATPVPAPAPTTPPTDSHVGTALALFLGVLVVGGLMLLFLFGLDVELGLNGSEKAVQPTCAKFVGNGGGVPTYVLRFDGDC